MAAVNLGKTGQKFLRSYSDPTLPENRQIRVAGFQAVLINNPIITQLQGIDELWNAIFKGGFTELDKYIGMRSDLEMPFAIKDAQPQGQHMAAKYHPPVESLFWYFKNRWEFRSTRSVNKKDVRLFVTDEDYQAALAADVRAQSNWLAWLKFLLLIGMIFEETELKKFAQVKDGSGMNPGKEWHDLIYPASDVDVPMMMQHKTIEQLAVLWKDGKPVGPCKVANNQCAPDGAGPYSVKEYPMSKMLKLLNKAIKANEVTATKYASSKDLNKENIADDILKLLGFGKKIRECLNELTTIPTTKYNIAVDSSDASKYKDIFTNGTEPWTNKLLGRRLGLLQLKPDGTEFIPQPIPQRHNIQDLIMIYNPKDFEALDDGLINVMHKNVFDKYKIENIECGLKIPCPLFKSGEVLIFHKNALNIYQRSADAGQAPYNEHGISNIWAEIEYDIGCFPFPCFIVKKPT